MRTRLRRVQQRSRDGGSHALERAEGEQHVVHLTQGRLGNTELTMSSEIVCSFRWLEYVSRRDPDCER